MMNSEKNIQYSEEVFETSGTSVIPILQWDRTNTGTVHDSGNITKLHNHMHI